MLLATLLVVVFGYIFLAPTAYAADASWKDDALFYEGNTYKKIDTPAAINQMSQYRGITMYEYKSGQGSSQIIYFDAGVDPQNAGEAHYVRFTLNPPNFSDEKTITVTPSGTTANSSGSTSGESSCELDGIGWIICPISKAIAESMDFLYGVVSDFFRVTPLTTTQGSLYQMWEVFRNAANVLFVIGFLIIIYGQISGAMLSNYTIKKLLPRLIISAILVNVSYWICAIAVDISNILGYAVADLFTNLRDVAGAPNSDAANTPTPTWVNVTAAVLAGGSLAVAGGAALAIAAGTGMGMAFLLLSALLPALFAVLVAVAILAARQALITVFVILAPLAFVAYLLPNTEEWFTRWRKTFTTMLVMFPAFSVIFGGAQLAGTVIIQNAPNIIVVILGMTVQIVPLFITPFLIKLSSGLMATIANITNDRGKGLFDRTKNWADTRRGQEQATGRMRRDMRAKTRGYNDGRRPTRTRTGQALSRLANPRDRAYYKDYKRREREGMKSASEAMSEGLFGQTAAGGRIHDRTKDAGLEKHYGESANARRYNAHMQSGLTAQDRYRNSLHHQAHINEGVSKLAEDSMTAHAERDLQTSINANATLRGLKIGADVDSAHAKLQAASVEGDAKLAFQTEVDNDRALRLMKVGTFVAEQQATSIDNRLTKNAEARWNQLSRTDANLQELRFQEVQATDSAKLVEAEWNTLIENIKVHGGDAPQVSAQNESLANSIKRIYEDTTEKESIQQAIKAEAEGKAQRKFIQSQQGRKFNIRAQAAKDALESAQAEESALVQEWRTEKGAEGLTGDEAQIAATLRDADIQKRAQTQRSAKASDTANQEYAQKVVKDEIIPDGTETIAEVAGGVAGAAGVSQAKATATQVTFEAFGKAVSAEKTLVSRNTPAEILDEKITNPSTGSISPGLGSPDILDEPEERITALAGKVASGSHHASHIRLWERMGQLRRQATDELTTAEASGDQAAIDKAKDRIGKVKSLEQQVMDDKAKIPFGVGDTDMGAANVGDYSGNIYESTRARINTHMSAANLAKMDPDDIRLIFEMARAGKLSDAEIRKVKTAYNDWQNDDNLKSAIQDKHRFLLDSFESYTDGSSDVSGFPQPGDQLPSGITHANFWNSAFESGVNSMSNPS